MPHGLKMTPFSAGRDKLWGHVKRERLKYPFVTRRMLKKALKIRYFYTHEDLFLVFMMKTFWRNFVQYRIKNMTTLYADAVIKIAIFYVQ